jgi:hypothetical protein
MLSKEMQPLTDTQLDPAEHGFCAHGQRRAVEKNEKQKSATEPLEFFTRSEHKFTGDFESHETRL